MTNHLEYTLIYDVKLNKDNVMKSNESNVNCTYFVLFILAVRLSLEATCPYDVADSTSNCLAPYRYVRVTAYYIIFY